jgi:hypothetical protein
MILASHGLIASQITQFVGLLDLYPNAAAAYSLRKLRTAYTGSAIRVRRTNLDEMDIGFTSSGELDTTALLAFTGTGVLNNGFVKTWYDQSGNARNATQLTAVNQPQIVSAGSVLTKYGKPNFTFTTQFLQIGTQVALQNNNSLFSVFNSSATGSGAFINYMTNPSDDPEILLGVGDQADVYMNGGYVYRQNISAISGGLYNQIIQSGSTAILRRNGSQIVTGTRSGTLTTTARELTIGRYIFVNAFRNGNISELVIYNIDQTANQVGIENNINSFYSIY